MTKRATKNYVAYGRDAIRAAAAGLMLLSVAACSGSDTLVGASSPTSHSAVEASAQPRGGGPNSASSLPAGVSATGADGFPNVNVDTARRQAGASRTAADMDRLEAELLALGARQKAGADTSAPGSVIQELQDLGRRSKRETEKAIESGTAPDPH